MKFEPLEDQYIIPYNLNSIVQNNSMSIHNIIVILTLQSIDYTNTNNDDHLNNIVKLLKSKDSTIQRMGIELYKEYIK